MFGSKYGECAFCGCPSLNMLASSGSGEAVYMEDLHTHVLAFGQLFGNGNKGGLIQFMENRIPSLRGVPM